MTDVERDLLHLLKQRSVRRGEFRLASGASSTFYIDGKMAAIHSRGAFLIGEVLWERTRHLPINAIGGLELGAIPLTVAAVISYHRHGQSLEGFWVRDQAKRHGTQKMIEGNLPPHAKVVLVDDVITTGGSVLRAAEEVRKEGAEIVGVVALVDRQAGAADRLREQGIFHYEPIFTLRDLGLSDG
ncbi:MAG: orotate phosphoribosyltransferase [Gemmataceae bacterium]|nr:orotate phosphoribosyltransferase [Gemmataceae bacterium]MDW8263855.1 orotate phosphoribosyltransferase [Gemmataceae bacterium]